MRPSDREPPAIELVPLRPEDEWLTAWPSVTNDASNALCRSLGFRHVGVAEFQFRGHSLRCNDWFLPAGEY